MSRRRFSQWRPDLDDVRAALPAIVAAATRAGEGARRSTVLLAVYAALREHSVRAHDAHAILGISTSTTHRRRLVCGPELAAARAVAAKVLPRPPARASLLEVATAVMEAAAVAEGIDLDEAATSNSAAAVRARIAAVRVLRERHRMPFEQIADLLGLARTTCSHLARGARGKPDQRNPANRAASTVTC